MVLILIISTQTNENLTLDQHDPRPALALKWPLGTPALAKDSRS